MIVRGTVLTDSSVGTGEVDTTGRRVAGHHALAGLGWFVFVEGDEADGGFGFLFDAGLGGGGAVPVGAEEAALLDLLLEGLVVVDVVGVLAAIGERTVVQALLDLGQQAGHGGREV